METNTTGKLRTFETGATRDSEAGKHDYEGYLSPLVLERFGEYMTVHRVQSDGSVRDSDNWQKGIPQKVYLKSAFRHFLDWWKLHRGYPVTDPKTGKPVTVDEALCALIFNVQGYLHEWLKAQSASTKPASHLVVRQLGCVKCSPKSLHGMSRTPTP